MSDTKLGKVCINENEEMMNIYNKRAALDELMCTISKTESPELYKKVNDELKSIVIEYEKWWECIKNKYNWIINENEYLILDFDTCEIIVKEKPKTCCGTYS